MSQTWYTSSTRPMQEPEPDPQPDIYVTELARKLKFIYKAAGNDDMVTIPRQLLADTLVALLEDELVEKRRAEKRAEYEAKAEAQRQYMEQMKIAQGISAQEEGRIVRFNKYEPIAPASAAHEYTSKVLEAMKINPAGMTISKDEVAKLKEDVKKGWFRWNK